MSLISSTYNDTPVRVVDDIARPQLVGRAADCPASASIARMVAALDNIEATLTRIRDQIAQLPSGVEDLSTYLVMLQAITAAGAVNLTAEMLTRLIGADHE